MEGEQISDAILKCGIIMPISELDGCTDHHWREVKNIFTDAIKDARFEAELVSEADDVGIIQKRIIQNIYENPIIVCDVSGKNPNVMFELGLRLAFDKPTIIVKDDKTNYSFDTSPIEHLTYPRDLRYTKIIEFKEKLALKIRATYEKSSNDPAYTTFLKNFGEFTTPKLETKEISKEDFILEELKELKKQIILFGRKQLDVNEDSNSRFILSHRKNNLSAQLFIDSEVKRYLENTKIKDIDIDEFRQRLLKQVNKYHENIDTTTLISLINYKLREYLPTNANN